MQKVILGFVGQISSGKGTISKYYQEKYNASCYRFSTILRDLLNRIYTEQNRDNLIKISECVRQTFGENILAKAIAGDADKDQNELVIVDGIRRMADIEFLSKLPNFTLIKIEADPKIRWERLVQRSENSDDKTKTFEEFLADHQRSTELTIPEVMSHATEAINNDGDLNNLHKQLDELLKKIRG